MSMWDVNRLGAALLCVGAAVGGCVLTARVLVPDTAPARPEMPIAGADAVASPASPGIAPIAERLAHASVDRGATLAMANCSACHTLEQGGASMVGPNLFGVVDRPVASDAGFQYSDALKALGGRWSPERLDRWLYRPQAMAPGTLMGFAGLPDPDQRADLIAYLRQQAPPPQSAARSPAALPGALPGASPGTSAGMSPGSSAGASPGTSLGALPGVTTAGSTAGSTGASTGGAPGMATGVSPAGFETLVEHADAKQGAQVAATQCSACHGFDQGGGAQVGPNLFGVVGRGIAQGADFSYSAALSAHHGTWTVAALDDWLADPKRFAPGTRMGFAGIADPATRAQVVAYLRTLHP